MARCWRVCCFLTIVVVAMVSLVASLHAGETLARDSDVTPEAYFRFWPIVRVLDPYGSGLPEAGVWVNPRSGAKVTQLIDL